MEIVIRAAGAAVVGSILALLLKKHTPELSLSVSVVCGAVIVWFAVSVSGKVRDLAEKLAQYGNMTGIYLSPVMKCVGIGLVTHLAAQICRDAQQGSIAASVELCGTVCALYVSLPLVEALLAIVEKLV